MAKIKRPSRTFLLGGLLAAGLAAVASGQTGQPAPPARTQMDELLTEVRAIRADLDRAAAASLRGQLLGMRLQLQEQRITTLSRQLSDVQQRLRANQQARLSIVSSLKMFASEKEQTTDKEREQMDIIFGPLKQQIALLDKADADLKVEESGLLSQLHDEQNRWSGFNGQIEELERSTSGKAKR
jgi:chromosome segregation ATPase